MEERFETKKSLGQHFLNNTHVPEAMVQAGEVVEGDKVIEIGPGTGALTRALLETGASVLALEADARAIDVLKKDFDSYITSGKLTIEHVDVRKLALEQYIIAPASYKVVANIPYYLSGRLFRLFLEHSLHPSDLVFLVQKEVAERIARNPKESILSLSVKVFGTPKYVQTVKKGNFTPPPKVDSAIVAVRNISHDCLAGIGATLFFDTVHLGFASKRKQLLGNLASQYPRDSLMHIFSTLNLPENVRAEDVRLEIWLELCKKLKSLS